MTISVGPGRPLFQTEVLSERIYFTADLFLGSSGDAGSPGRPADFEKRLMEGINDTLLQGDILVIAGGLFSPLDSPVGFARGRVWYRDDFDIPDRIRSMKEFRRDIRLLMVYGERDDESFLTRFQNDLGLKWITAVLPVKPCGAEALVLGSPPGPGFSSLLPVICGCTGLNKPEGVIDVGVERIGFIPLDAQGMAGSIRGIARAAYVGRTV